MEWNMEEIQQRFHRKQRIIENDLIALRHHKIPEDQRYKKFHDFELGALLVYIILETTSELASNQRLLERLKEMLKEDLPDSSEAYSIENLHKGWTSEIEKLIAEFTTTQQQLTHITQVNFRLLLITIPSRLSCLHSSKGCPTTIWKSAMAWPRWMPITGCANVQTSQRSWQKCEKICWSIAGRTLWRWSSCWKLLWRKPGGDEGTIPEPQAP